MASSPQAARGCHSPAIIVELRDVLKTTLSVERFLALLRHAPVDVRNLPRDRALLAWLGGHRAHGRDVVLVAPSASGEAFDFATSTGVFTRIIPTRDPDSSASLVLDGPFVRVGQIEGAPRDARPARWRLIARALRLHQWAKNALLFLPLLASHRMSDPALAGRAVLAFLAFGLCASSVYVQNDLLDLETDRMHPKKAARPFAAGDLPLEMGPILAGICTLASIAVASFLPRAFLALLLVYAVTTLAYSALLKKKLLVDVHVLAGLYTLRVIAGAAAVDLAVSSWLLAFSLFLFLSLALLKRYAELRELGGDESATVPGRSYCQRDLHALSALGASSGFMTVLVLALYIESPRVTALYDKPIVLWLLCPLLLYWLSRVWVVAHRGEMDHDPVLFALRDKVSHAIGFCAAVVAIVAAVGW